MLRLFTAVAVLVNAALVVNGIAIGLDPVTGKFYNIKYTMTPIA